MKRIQSILMLACLFSATIALADGDASLSTSALMNQALDAPMPEVNLRGGLLDIMKGMENQSNVRIEAAPAVWDDLPWGQDTNLIVNCRNTTLRHALDTTARRTGLTYTIGAEAIVFEPSPAMSRIGRRSTLPETRVLDIM